MESLETTYAASSHSIFMFQDKILSRIYIDDLGTLLITRDPEMLPENFVAKVIPHGLITYDESKLHFRYEYGPLAWTRYEHVAEPGMIQLMKTVVNKFQLNEKPKNDLIRGLEIDMLQLYNSCVVIRTLEIRNGELVIRLVLKMLDKHMIRLRMTIGGFI